MTEGDFSRRVYLDVAFLAAAILLLEGTLLRLLAVAQFYHFAFLVVSLALLGFGASGTLLSVSRRLQTTPLPTLLPLTGIAFACSVAITYGVVNWLPFDSYSIAWQRIQILYFVLYYLALTLPFLCGGLAIGAALAAGGGRSHLVYAANLVGSGVGAVLALVMLRLAGVPGALLAAAIVALIPAWSGRLRWITGGAIVLLATAFVWYGIRNLEGNAPLGLTISPYKGLAYARQYPGAERIYGAWNEIARVDVMQDAGTRQLPGLSYTYPANPPPQHGLTLDAGAVMPVTLVDPADFEAAAYLPEAIAYSLRPQARVLTLEPGAGLAVLQALAGGAESVTAVTANTLELRAAETAGAHDVYAHPDVHVIHKTGRVFLRRPGERYDIVVLPLTDPYQPVSSGAYSLSESYLLTEEAFTDMLARLDSDGILMVTRWLQMPPSESVRLLSTMASALEESGIDDPADRLVMMRSMQTATLLVQPSGWSQEELAQIHAFAEEKRFDMVWSPDISSDDVNRHSRMPEPLHYEAAAALLQRDRHAYVQEYPFAIGPATDDRPFFFHFFRWEQTPEVLATLGRTWQPFGGSGYFILLAMLALVILLSSVLILLPLLVMRRLRGNNHSTGQTPRLRAMVYFGFIGLAFLLVEIPLIQQWILVVGHPVYAFTAVVLALLMLSSVGSALSRRKWAQSAPAFGVLVALAIITPFLTARYVDFALGWPIVPRTAGATLLLAPLAILMGMPFPRGLYWLERKASWLAPWAWAVNGCASVISGVIAAILALSYGFTVVLLIGAGCYAGAWAALPRVTGSATADRA